MDEMPTNIDVMEHYRTLEQTQPIEDATAPAAEDVSVVAAEGEEKMVDLYRVVKTSLVDSYLDKPEEGKPYNPKNIPCVTGDVFLTTDDQGNDVRVPGKNAFQHYKKGEKVLHFFDELENAARYIEDYTKAEFNADCSILHCSFPESLVKAGSSVGFYKHSTSESKENIREVVIPLSEYDPHKNFVRKVPMQEYAHLIPGGARAVDPDLIDYGGFGGGIFKF